MTQSALQIFSFVLQIFSMWNQFTAKLQEWIIRLGFTCKKTQANYRHVKSRSLFSNMTIISKEALLKSQPFLETRLVNHQAKKHDFLNRNLVFYLILNILFFSVVHLKIIAVCPQLKMWIKSGLKQPFDRAQVPSCQQLWFFQACFSLSNFSFHNHGRRLPIWKAIKCLDKGYWTLIG